MIYFYTSLITYFIYTILKYKESLILLQKNNYDSKKYKKEIKNLFINKELIIIALIVIALNLDLKSIEISTIIAYTVLAFLKLKEKNKIKLEKKTIARILALLIIFISLNIWFVLDYKSYHNPKGLIFDNSAIYYIILYLYTYISYLITLIINIIVKPIDKLLK